jgi:maltose O-acetyltransferase
MLGGDEYDSRDAELLAMAHRARALLAEYSASASADSDGRRAILERLLGDAGPEVWIEPPFFCDYGAHVHIGARSFVNVNCVFLDSARIEIGPDTLNGPAVQLLTVTPPLRAEDRSVTQRATTGSAPYRTLARPIRIGARCWIGAGTIVLPGVTIGDDVTIGAGSIVTADVPAGSLALGQPCRVQRSLR